MVKFCKEELNLESVSIVNNGSKVTEKWMSEYAYYLDIMAVSCDSFDGETNTRIGRFAKVSTYILKRDSNIKIRGLLK